MDVIAVSQYDPASAGIFAAGALLMAVGVALGLRLHQGIADRADRARRDYLDVPLPNPDGRVFVDIPPGVVLADTLAELYPECRHTLSLVDRLPDGASVEECTSCGATFYVDAAGLHPYETDGPY